MSSNFNDWQYLKYANDRICQDCASCLDSGAFNGKALRNYSVLVTSKNITALARRDIAAAIFNPPDPLFVFMVTFTHKKHIFFHARVNRSASKFHIATDNGDIEVEPERFAGIYNICQRLYQAGFSKSEIRSGVYRKWKKIESFGIEEFRVLDREIAAFRGSFRLNFLLHVLDKEDDHDQD